MTETPTGPVHVNWAIAIGVTDQGTAKFIDPDYTYRVRSRREATDDDIYAACAVATASDGWIEPHEELPFVTAFLMFQLPNGFIVASPDVHEDIIPVTVPSRYQIWGALEVLKGQIIAQKAANLAAPMAANATLAILRAGAKAANAAQGKSEGGLIVA